MIGLGLGLSLGNPAFAGKVLRIAASLGRISGANANGGNDGTNTQNVSRTAHRTGEWGVEAIRPVLANLKLLGTSPFGEAGVGNAVTYQGAFEYGGANTYAKFGGLSSVTVPDLSLFFGDGVRDFDPAQLFYYRNYLTVAAAANQWPRAQTVTQGSQYAKKGTNLLATFQATGVISGTPQDAANPPIAFLGMVDRRCVSVIVTGTSIEDNTGDLTTIDPDGTVGYASRGLVNVNGFNLPHAKLSRAGENMQSLADPVKGALRRSLYPYATHLLNGSPTNDMVTAAGRTIQNIQDDLMFNWNDFRSKGGQHVAQVDVIPRTNSSNVPLTNFEANGTSHRDVLNSWLNNECLNNGWINEVIPFSSVAEDPNARGSWLAGATSDWTHPLDHIHTAGAAIVNARASLWRAH